MEVVNDDHGDDGVDTTDDGTDRDGDGLSDYMEYYLTWTSPVLIDTDEDGISDADPKSITIK
jgi:hypothetical protein